VVWRDLPPILPQNPSKTPDPSDQPPLEKVNIPTDLDERIEEYLKEKQKKNSVG